MGSSCSCIKSSKMEKVDFSLDSNRIRELSNKYINKILCIANQLKSNFKIYATLIRVQAKIRGLIVRNKVKSNTYQHVKMMPYHDPDSRFKPAIIKKIVRN